MRRPGLWVANGNPADVTKMLSWRPGALTSFFDYLGPNRVQQYKQQYPDTAVIVRFQHPRNWHVDAAASAQRQGDMVVSKWPELRDLDAYVYFCNEVNLHYENGDDNVGNQPQYESGEFYQRYATWVRQAADRIKQRVPEIKLVCPPFAFGHHEDGAPDDNGNPKEGWAGYDYLAETIKSHFNSIITFHAYWGNSGGSVHDWLYDPEISSWYAFRWRRVLNLFERRYQMPVRVIIDEAGNFGASDSDFTDQVIHYSQQTLADPRVIALTFFLWQDPTRSPGNLPNSWVDRCFGLDNHVARLAALPDVAAGPGPLQPTPPGKTIRVLMPNRTVRVMEVEEYLRGVVATEMPIAWPLEAVKAQAVAARSYAMAAVAHPRHQPDADICTGTHCQAYNEARINPNGDQAVQQTRGQVALSEGELATTYYSANCGGHTVGNETVFGGPPLPYLRPVACINPGPKNGHGIGLCQWGAHDMAQRGDSYEVILKHYYTGIQISREPQSPDQPGTGTAEIRGRVIGADSKPVTDIRLRLSRSGWVGETLTGTDGSYCFANLPPGTYDLLVVGYSLRREGLTLAEGQQLVVDLDLSSQTPTTWRMEVERKPGLPLLVGSLPRGGIEITLQTPLGTTFKRESGSKPQYGLGGFEFWAPNHGLHTLSFLDQTFEFTLEGHFCRLTFTEAPVGTDTGVVRGQLRDQDGAPVAGRRITLTGSGISQSTTTDSDGSYEFNGLSEGDYTVNVPDTDLSQTIHCDGKSPATLPLVLPSAQATQYIMKVTRPGGAPYIAGTLPEPGIALVITTPIGQQMRLVSGSRRDLGVGGFCAPAPAHGTYTIRFLDQSFELPMDGQFTFVTFVLGVTSSETQARVVSQPMGTSQAEVLLEHLNAQPLTRGLFEMNEV
jgi:hypothetical protein